uniref:Uncharacterized protein n=1 Tax=Rhizophora mucronata TaxID=61149 RepID=A0A2P2MZ59_RHIMU
MKHHCYLTQLPPIKYFSIIGTTLYLNLSSVIATCEESGS